MPSPDQEQSNAYQWEGEHFKATLHETNSSFQASIAQGTETVLFTYTPATKKVEFEFGTQEPKEASEYPPITIEGYPVGPHKYNKETRHYSLTIAHHPNPNNRKGEVVYYDLVADGEKAVECFALRITDTRLPVHATGDDLSRMVKKKRGVGERMVREVRLDSLEIIHGRLDSPTILRQKIKLANMR